jgi:hypothetical protein
MASDRSDRSESRLDEEERRWLDRVRAAGSLAELQTITDADSEHDAYIEAKPAWERLRDQELGEPSPTGDIPGDRVTVEGQPFHVHGITHADTAAERTFLREHVKAFLADGAAVHCEQGIRPMYFDDFDGVTEIDDYRWAMHHCRQLEISSHIDGIIEETFEEGSGVAENIRSAALQFREVTFSLIDSGSDVYGDTFAAALGDVASTFLMDHEHLATGEDFRSHEISQAAARDPGRLADLQQYYNRVFLPQPLEREWLRRHDIELELFTHARNERIAAWVLYHAAGTQPVHLLVGAAHQPGVTYYLDAYRESRWDYGEFELVA